MNRVGVNLKFKGIDESNPLELDIFYGPNLRNILRYEETLFIVVRES